MDNKKFVLARSQGVSMGKFILFSPTNNPLVVNLLGICLVYWVHLVVVMTG